MPQAHGGNFNLMTEKILWDCELPFCLKCAGEPEELDHCKPSAGFYCAVVKQQVTSEGFRADIVISSVDL